MRRNNLAVLSNNNIIVKDEFISLLKRNRCCTCLCTLCLSSVQANHMSRVYTVQGLFFRVTIFPNFSFLGVSVSNISKERTYVFFISDFPVLCSLFFIFSIPRSRYVWLRTCISPCPLSPDMYCIVFSCAVYSRLKAFGTKRENKTHWKSSHSTVCISTIVNCLYLHALPVTLITIPSINPALALLYFSHYLLCYLFSYSDVALSPFYQSSVKLIFNSLTNLIN